MLRVLFAGTPDIGVPSLRAIEKKHNIVGVLTNPDRVKGRGRKVQYSPIKEAALDLGLKVMQPLKLNKECREEIGALKPDILVCIAYGKIFSAAFLDLFPMGGVNLHPSRLPDLRGPSPLNSTLLRGDLLGAISIQKLGLEMDSGDILFQEDLTIAEDETCGSLGQKVADLGAPYMVDVLNNLENGTAKSYPQDGSKATFCAKIDKNDGLIDWTKGVNTIDCLIRAYTPWPHGFTFWKNQRLNIIKAKPYRGTLFEDENKTPGLVLGLDKKDGIVIQTGEGLLSIQELQLQSKKALDYKSFINGVKDFTSSIVGDLDE